MVFLEDMAGHPEHVLTTAFENIGVAGDVPIRASGEARNRSSDFRRDGRVMRLMRRARMDRRLARVLPEFGRAMGCAALTSPERFTPEWDREVWQETADAYASDSGALLRYCGKPDDFWSLDLTLDDV